MNPAIDKAVRSRWLAGVIHAALWIMVYLTILGLQSSPTSFRVADGSAAPQPGLIPVEKIDPSFSANWPSLAPSSNQPNLFLTSYFTPPPAPAPPAATTRKVQLAYLGFYEADGSKKQAIIKMGEQFLITQLGALITANLYAAEASATNAMLTNTAGQTNLLVLNQSKEVEVPIK